MTTTTHTAAAMLSVAVAALEAQNKAHKTETGEVLYALGQDMGNGVKFRELKAWAKEFKAKQSEVAPKAAPKAAVKTPAAKAPNVMLDGPKPTRAPKAAVETPVLKSTEVRDQVVLIGRKGETVLRVVKDKESGAPIAVTDKGTRILMADIERNNRGNLRVMADAVSKYDAKAPVAPAPKTAAVKPAAKAPASKKPAADDFESEATEVRKFPIRHLEIVPSSNLAAAEYDRNTQTLNVTFKDGAVWAYAGVKLSEAKALETAESAGKFFAAHIKDVKKGKMVKTGTKPAASAAKAAAKTPAAKTPVAAPKAAPKADAVEFTGTQLRDAVYMNGRKPETIVKVVKGTNGERTIVTDAGTRVAVASLRMNNRGKFVADETPAPKATVKPAAKVAAAKPADNVRKTTGNKKANFAEHEAPKKMHTVEAMPTINDVKDAEVRVIKGSKETMAKILRVVNREGVRYAVTENRFPLPFNNIIFMDGQLTYTGKPLTAEEFRAL